jgi:cold shock CspA family protein
LDVFVHANQLRWSGIEDGLAEGDKVTFTIDKGPKGPFATNIKQQR